MTAMRFQLLGPWPIHGSAMLIPEGAIIEYEPGAASATIASFWEPGRELNGTAVPIPLPANAKALTQESYNQMCDWLARAGSLGVLIYSLRYSAGVVPKRFIDGKLI